MDYPITLVVVDYPARKNYSDAEFQPITGSISGGRVGNKQLVAGEKTARDRHYLVG